MRLRALVAGSAGFVAGLVAVVGVVQADHPGAAKEPTPAAQPSAFVDVPSLTAKVRELHVRLQQADSSTRAQSLAALVSAARARQSRLAALIEDAPAEVLQAAMSAHERSRFPAEVKAHLEEEAAEDGEIDVLHADGGTGGDRYLYSLRSNRGRLAVSFARKFPNLMTGDLVQVRGVRVGQAMAADGGPAGVTLLSAALPNTMGEQKTLVIVVNFSNSATYTASTVSQFNTLTFGTGASTTNYYREASYGETWLTGSVVGPYTMSMSSSGCDYWGISSLARSAAANAGVNLSNYRRYVYAFPSNGCGWAGLGSVGGDPSQAWINGNYQSNIVVHEFGHNLGLFHSHALECGSAVIATGCSSIEYGDTLDAMGASGGPYHFNAVQKELLGWLNDTGMPPITHVQANGVYTIDPYETDAANPKALKVRAPNGDWYYVEYRQPIGFDAAIPSSSRTGVVVHVWKGMSGDGIYLLDMTPSTTTWQDPALQVNSTFSDPAAGITISPLWANATNAGVSVTVGGGATCTRANPTIAVSPTAKSGAAGTRVSYSVSITNNDQNCAAAVFSGNAAAPSGWQAGLTTSSLTISPGATATTTLNVTSAGSATPGNYAINVTASASATPSYTAGASATYGVTQSGGGTAGSFADAFERADAADLGSAWQSVTGSLGVSGRQAKNAESPGMHMSVVAGLTGAAQNAQAEFTPADTNYGPRFGVLVRYKDPNNYYACYRNTGEIRALRIVRVVNGIESILARLVVVNPRKGQSFTVGCTAQGNTLTLALDGVAKLTATDATFSSGKAGLMMGYWNRSGRPKAHAADDFTAQVN